MFGLEDKAVDHKYDIERDNNSYQNASKLKEQEHKNAVALEKLAAGNKIAYAKIVAGIEEGKTIAQIQREFDILKTAYPDASDAEIAQMYVNRGGKGKGEEKLSGEDNAIAGILTSSQNKYLNGDFDGALQPLYELKALIDDPESDYSKKASQDAKAALISKIAEIEDAKAQALKNNNNPTNNNSSTPPEKTTTNNRGGYNKDNSREFEDSFGRKVSVPKNSNNESNDTNLNDSVAAKEAVKKAGGLTGYNNFRRVN